MPARRTRAARYRAHHELVTAAAADIARAVHIFEARIVALEADVSRLEKENASLWTTVHEFQDTQGTS